MFDKLVGIFVELVRGGLTAVLALATHDGHAVLREGAGLVGADAAGGPEGLHWLQVLHEHVLGSHALRSDGESDGDSRQQSFRHISHNDTNHEHQTGNEVVDEEWEYEECYSQCECHYRNDLDEVLYLDGNRSHHCLGVSHHLSNQTHEGGVTHFDHQTFTLATLDECSLEHEILGFKREVIDVVSKAFEFHTFSGQATVVHVEVAALEYTHVRWDAHSIDNVHDVSNNDLLGQDCDQFASSHYTALCRDLVLEWSHGFICILILLETKESS